MKPVAVFRHAASEGPGYFATYLERHGIPWRLVGVDTGEAVPENPGEFSGLAFMGGPMSANDDLPWISAELRLIRLAVDSGIPVLGHCLGGQLMARALGGEVTRNPLREIGWGQVDVERNEAAARWLGQDHDPFECFHWHGETFSIPPGATRILSSRYCANQAFVIGPHLAMQCHVEMTPELIRSWCDEWGREVQALARHVPSVQSPAQMLENVEERTRRLNAVADRFYDRWVAGLDRQG
jgi:GMP synthase-like glutamine amidotransferase